MACPRTYGSNIVWEASSRPDVLLKMSTAYPANEEEFLGFIEDIDAELKQQGLLITARPIGAIREACKRLKTSLPVAPLGPPLRGDYNGESLSAHINEWYEKRYGKRLGIDFDLGSVATLIRNDLWKVNLPRFYGDYRLNFGQFPKKEELLRLRDQGDVFPLTWIEGLTQSYAQSLTEPEIREIAGFMVFALKAIWRLSGVEHQKYLPQARVDLANAVNTLFMRRPNFGQSKWASLQFAEKIFKSYLAIKNVPFPTGSKGHDLAELAKLSEQNGLKGLKPILAACIQCKSGVRYGEVPVVAADAIRAHHASIVVCNIACSAIGSLTGAANVPQFRARPREPKL